MVGALVMAIPCFALTAPEADAANGGMGWSSPLNPIFGPADGGTSCPASSFCVPGHGENAFLDTTASATDSADTTVTDATLVAATTAETVTTGADTTATTADPATTVTDTTATTADPATTGTTASDATPTAVTTADAATADSSSTTATSSPATAGPIGIPGAWNLTLDSEFSGSSLDTSIWRAGWFGSGVTAPVSNFEIDCYSSSNVTFPGNGTVQLSATDQSSTCKGVTQPYTGAVLSTDPEDGRAGGGFSFTYGVVEAKVYLPADGNQVADWPGIFTTGQVWPLDGEDDIMEGLGGTACFHFHDPLGGPGACDRTIKPGWNTFASDWEPGKVTYYYDGVDVGSIATGITSAPMYIALDNAVSDESTTIGSSAMQVAYVRVWQH